jgi:hypothetical protein
MLEDVGECWRVIAVDRHSVAARVRKFAVNSIALDNMITDK